MSVWIWVGLAFAAWILFVYYDGREMVEVVLPADKWDWLWSEECRTFLDEHCNSVRLIGRREDGDYYVAFPSKLHARRFRRRLEDETREASPR